VLALVVACGPKPAPADGNVEERVVVERQPDGSIKKTTIRTTRHVVSAKPPPIRLGDPYPSDPLVRYNVERVNAYRAKKAVAPVVYDAAISTFATRGSERLARDHAPHAHFMANGKGFFTSAAAENQGDPNGVPVLDADPAKNGRRQVDTMLELMFAEGPGGGHYDNMMNARFRRIGVGLVYAGGKLYMTNDFSE